MNQKRQEERQCLVGVRPAPRQESGAELYFDDAWDVFVYLYHQGNRFRLCDDDLLWFAEPASVTPDMRRLIAKWKAGLIQVLRKYAAVCPAPHEDPGN